MERFYLFTRRGISGRYFCGRIIPASAKEELLVDGDQISFGFAERLGLCKSFKSESTAKEFRRTEMEYFEQGEAAHIDSYAPDAVCLFHGVDDNIIAH